MKIVFMSDTHGQHKRLEKLPEADVLIHAGDMSKKGRHHEIEDFLKWFSKLDYKYKIFIAGNHDFYLERERINIIQRSLPENVYYLCDSGIELEGVHFWGSPITPTFFNWAFNRDRGEEIRKHWDKIPAETDVLITHGPPYGILDKILGGVNTGCEDLLNKIELIEPKYHLFGHIHEAYGAYEKNNTIFVNGSISDENYNLKNEAVVIDLKID